MKQMLKNKQGGFTDLFLFMIFAFILILFSAVFIYIGVTVTDELKAHADDFKLNNENTNVTVVIDQTIGQTNTAYQSLYWISIFLIGGMILGIFIGSYLVTTKPVFFIPYIFITIIAVIVAVGIANAYEQVIINPTLASTFANFVGANFIMLRLPMWISIIGIAGGIIMFVRMGTREETYPYG